MRPARVKVELKKRFNKQVKRPVFLRSAPGSGKSEIAEQVAKELKVDFIAVHTPLLQPEDYGLPVPNKERDGVNFVVDMTKFPVEGSKFKDKGIIVFEEVAQADQAIQKIVANIFQTREIHGKKFKKGWMIIVTGNRVEDRAGASRLLSHLNNRLTRVNLDVALTDWVEWASANGVHHDLVSFLNFKPELLSHFDPQAEVNATPRSWVQGVGERIGDVDEEDELEVYAGDVGEGPAAEFISFVKIARKITNPDLIILNPTKAKVPEAHEVSLIFATVGALAYRATEDNFGKILTYMKRLPQEYMAFFIKYVSNKDPEICNTKAFIDWSVTPVGKKVLGTK